MRRILKLFLLVITMSAFLLLASCSNEITDIDAKYLDLDPYAYGIQTEHGKYFLIKEYSELEAFVYNTSVPKEYDNDFFNTKSLVAITLWEPSGGNRNEIKSYSLSSSTIIINIETTSYGSTCDMRDWLFLLEVNRDDLAGIKNAKILQNDKDITR